ncbi:1,4-alpha-glucan branching protein GlgB [Nocardioides euryhalodurans]|uniref:1,4-alpha-glucan branching enzyme GlgB n=1 Tax=Nocardioides euryhalodurans TaxID=2518370 RepID=A0A4P7GIE3_9ACTN|nr:1,4-alpha-glucan branching protein GlgB [Nocardioides euryhalodurans]QBR91676.1 1,4-alpha-glucan branching protein GlgB [Nocardioides euryhalodurans]
MSAVLPVSHEELDLLVRGEHGHPHAVLGPHPHDGAVTVRVLKPLASSVVVAWGEERVSLDHEHEGVWVGVLPTTEVPGYRLEVSYDGGPTTLDDPYRFLPTLGEMDLHLINEGRHENLWDVLGARVHHYDGPLGDTVSGTAFAVWAPSARGVRVKGSFNSWDGREHPMRQLGQSGVWELFVPDTGSGTGYKFAILGADGQWREKADPMAFHTEVPPMTSSVVFESTYTWGDDEWMAARASGEPPVEHAMSTYEMHLGSWRKRDGQVMTYAELADELVPYLTDLGFTHVEFLPVMEHPFGGSWGYQVTSYFAPTARFGDPDGFRHLVDRLHQAGIGVIVDWVPAHFPKDEFALARFDGTPLYEDPNPSRGEHPDWGTYVFNFGRREVRNFLVANALYWLEEFHVDGLRVDAVASMLYLDYSREPGQWSPNVHGGRENLEAMQFLQEMNGTVGKRVPGAMTIAEESTSWPGVTRPTSEGGLGFGFKWNMGWMHDSLGYVQHQPVHRSWHHGEMTFSIVYAWSEHYVLPISHDEVVHGKGSLLRKMPGDRWQQLANLRAYLGYMWAHPGKQLLFMGAELGQESEWAEARELDWWLLDHPEHRGVQSLVRDLNRVYRETPALWASDADPATYEWIDANDAHRNTFSFLRRSAGSPDLVCVANFADQPHHGYRLGLPTAGAWEEVLNTDAESYTGSGVGNLGTVTAVEGDHAGRPAYADIVVPPLATVWFRKRD